MNRFGAALWLCLSIVSWIFPISPQDPHDWYICTTGSDSTGTGSPDQPFRTIQHGLDRSKSGDRVIVLPGHYSGPGNAELNFAGKAVTLSSMDPRNPDVVVATLLDASSQKYIARFIHDEGPDTILEGFTLIGGERDPAQTRGLPGFFDFSLRARPTTRWLQVPADSSAGRSVLNPPLIGPAAVSYGTLAWEGFDPFHQPAATTRYHGSGDIDLNGIVSAADEAAAAQMAAGMLLGTAEADVNFDGVVTQQDIQLIHAAWNGSSLPGQWDRLSSSSDRNALVDSILALDSGNTHVYDLSWYMCYEFASQLYLHSAFSRADLINSYFDGGQTVYNLPVYMTSVSAPGFEHAINAILIGDDPLNFADWRLIEPQSDQTIQPGAWDLPYGSRVRISAYDRVSPGNMVINTLVVFDISQAGWMLVDHHPNLYLQRGEPEAQVLDNRADMWEPHLLPVGNGILLYDRQRDELSRVTDLHAARPPLNPNGTGQPLTLDGHYSRLLDWTRGPDGKLYLLWKGEVDGNPGLFSGELDPATLTISSTRRVASNMPGVSSGRILARSGELLAFWLKDPPTRDNPTRGIYWTRLRDQVWESYENLTPGMIYVDYRWPGWLRRDFDLYLFDVAEFPSGDLVLMYLEPELVDDNWKIGERRFINGEWSEPSHRFAAEYVRGLRIKVDQAGSLHVLYWTGQGQDQYDHEGRGNLFYRSQINGVWSADTFLDNSNRACCPDLAAGPEGVYAVWETGSAGSIHPAWSLLQNGRWTPVESLAVSAGTEAWYPTLVLLPGGMPVVTWSSRSLTLNAIEMKTLLPPGPDSYQRYFPISAGQ